MSKRLGLRQAHKVSFKNDFTEFAVTQTLSVHETLVLHTVDVACAAISYLFGCCEKTDEDASLVERTVDLSPIKRLTPDGAERRWKVPCLHQSVQPYKGKLVTKGNWSIFQAQLLPFGAVKSVHAFLCLARAVWWLGAVGCYLFWSSFFDDCIVFSPLKLAGSPELSAIALLKLLGWIFAEDGRKCNLFAVRCEALSVVFDLSDSNAGM